MKKKILLFGVPLLALTGLTSCGSNYKRDSLIFYIWGDSTEISWYEKIARDFTKETNISVSVQPSATDYYQNLNIMFSSQKTAPDIFFTESGQFPAHIASKKILNLNPYIESKALDVKTADNPNGEIELWDVNDAYRYDGKEIGKGDYYAFIKDWSPDFVLWFNKNHIDQYNSEHNLNKGDPGYMEYPSKEVPMTWDEFYDMSYKLTKPNRWGTMLDRVPYKHMMEMIQMTGSSTWINDNKYFNSKDPNVLKAAKFFTDLMVGEKASSPKLGPVATGSGEAFANGDLSFAFFGNWAYSSYHWDDVGFDFDCCPAPVPAHSDGSPITAADCYAGSCGMISLAVYKNTTLPEEAIKFLNYYMTKGNKYMAKKGYNIPGNKLVANSDDYKKADSPKLQEINNFFLNVANTYTHPIVYNKYLDQLTFETIVDNRMVDYFSNPKSVSLQSVLDLIAEDVRRNID